MKTLHITRDQAQALGEGLIEYTAMKDTSDRELFKGFEIIFGDTLVSDLQPDQGFEVNPIPNYLQIGED